MGALSVYFDASALVPLFVLDPFSVRANLAFRGRAVTPVISDFAAAEFASSIARRTRMRELNEEQAHAAFAIFDTWTINTIRVETLPADIRAAEVILRRMDTTLRTPDAIHIAIAQRVGAELATFDAKMADNALSLGLPLLSI